MRWSRLLVPAVLLFAACSDQTALSPEGDEVSPPTGLAVSDASTPGGNPGLYFTQPVKTPGEPGGPLNFELLPEVQVCLLEGTSGELPGPDCGTEPVVVASFPTGSFLPTEGSYRLNWDTDDPDDTLVPLDEDQFYRVRVLISDLEIGFFDVNPQSPGASEVIEGTHSFNIGSTIPIGFVLEEGVVCTADDGSVIECIEFTCELRAVGCTFTLDDEGEILGISIPPQGDGFPVPYETFRFERLDNDLFECIQGIDSPGFGPCSRVTPLGDLQDEPLVVPAINSICIDYAQVTDADGERRPYQMIRQSDDRTVTQALAAVPSTVCNGQTALGDGEATGLLGRLARTLLPVTRFFAPQPLKAIDLGRGGEVSLFSTFRFHLGYEVRSVGGSGGVGPAGGPLADPLPAVQAIDEKGKPVAGARIHFSIVAGDGTVTPSTGLTDAGGFAFVDAWTLGDRGTNTLTATSFGGYDEGDLPGAFTHMTSHLLQTGAATFEATAVGAPASVVATESDLGSTEVNTVLDTPLEVTVLDAGTTELQAQAVPGVEVTWTVESGNGFIVDGDGNEVQQLVTVTDAEGRTSIIFKLGTQAGENTVSATVGDLAPTLFTATGDPGAPAQVLTVSGDGQSAQVTAALADPLVVQVLDEFGNPVPGSAVTWSVPAGDGSTIEPLAADPNAAVLTLGPTPGSYAATAALGAINAQFTATAVCIDGFGSATLDGVLDPAEWACAYREALQVNLGGSPVQAEILWMNDADSVYFGVWVDGADQVNSLRIDFDNESNGVVDTGEDALNFDPSLAPGDRYSDEYLTERCTNRSQAGCGEVDPFAPDGNGAFENAGSVTIYELSKALDSGDAVHDFVPADFTANTAQPGVSGFVTFRLGNGAKGNTQWPGFRDFYFFPLAPLF